MSVGKITKIILAIFLVLFFVVVDQKIDLVRAGEYEDLQNQINNLTSEIKIRAPAQANNKAILKSLQDRVGLLKTQIDSLLVELEKKQKDINIRNDEFDQEYAKLSLSVRSYYIRSYYPSGLIIILGSQSAADAIRMLGIYSLLSKRDRDSIVTIATSLADLQKAKTQLQLQVDTISAMKKDVDAKAQFLAGEVAKFDEFIKQTQTQIAQLSARQQDILAQRLAGLHISRSAASLGRCDSDLTNGRDPGFSPKIAVFTYGVPNRVGLNQWGAYGRANAGQGYDQILHAYYNFDGYQNYDSSIQIRVDGYGTYGLEDYVKRIYEVPGDWPPEALKAQAIAARSYVLAYTNNGSGSICATEQCQVFKPDPKGGAWDQAVNDTEDGGRGKAMVQGGNPIKAWFSSTHGGYIHDSGGDIGQRPWLKNGTDATSSINNFSDLQNNAYDKASPWFYCDWGSRSDYNKTAWLKPEELADIVNTIILAEHNSSIQDYLCQTDDSQRCPNPWSVDRVKEELKKYTTPFNNISDVSVSADFGSGRTTGVNVSGDAGSHTFDGAEFKNFFNLRAPAKIQIVGPLYNIEKR